MAGWGWIFRHEFGKSGQDQTRSGLPKFVTENGWLRVDFPSRIWENWTRSNTIRAGWLRGDFPSQIWEIWTGSDTIRAGCLRVDFPSRIWEIWTGPDMIWAGWLSRYSWGRRPPGCEASVPAPQGHRRRAAQRLGLLMKLKVQGNMIWMKLFFWYKIIATD